MKNELSETGIAEDIIRSYVQMGCAEIHAMGLLNKATAELENGIIDVTDKDILQAQLEKLEGYREDIETYANLRRNMMKSLMSMFPSGNKDMWCQMKHLGIGAMTIFEAYEASDQDPELSRLAYEANRAFTKAISRFLGMEVTDCAACLADMLKGNNNNGNAQKAVNVSDA